MKLKYIAIAAATVALGGMGAFLGTGCDVEDDVAVEGTTQAATGCVMCADGCASICGSCVGDEDMTCLDCIVCSTCFLCYLDGSYKSCMTDDDDDDERQNSRTLKSNYDISSAPLAGTKGYSVITVKLDYELEGGETPLSDAHIHGHLNLADGRVISATQEVGDIYDGQEKSAEFKFYVERDISPETCGFSYALYGND